MMELLLLQKGTTKCKYKTCTKNDLTKQRNYVQSVKTGESLNESQVRNISLPPVKFSYWNLQGVASRRILE